MLADFMYVRNLFRLFAPIRQETLRIRVNFKYLYH